jgi:hypothetical protein
MGCTIAISRKSVTRKAKGSERHCSRTEVDDPIPNRDKKDPHCFELNPLQSTRTSVLPNLHSNHLTSDKVRISEKMNFSSEAILRLNLTAEFDFNQRESLIYIDISRGQENKNSIPDFGLGDRKPMDEISMSGIFQAVPHNRGSYEGSDIMNYQNGYSSNVLDICKLVTKNDKERVDSEHSRFPSAHHEQEFFLEARDFPQYNIFQDFEPTVSKESSPQLN